jgi:SAM-dependent methyltransferase
MAADVLCQAEDLPFADGSFDVVTCRLAAHHFVDVEAGTGEMARVAADRVLVVDNLWMGEQDEEASRLRDPSHVRNYSEEEWRGLFAGAGLAVGDAVVGERRIAFDAWLERTATSGDEAERIRELLADRIVDGRLRIDRIALKGRKG